MRKGGKIAKSRLAKAAGAELRARSKIARAVARSTFRTQNVEIALTSELLEVVCGCDAKYFWTDGWIDGWMDGRTDGRMDGWEES